MQTNNPFALLSEEDGLLVAEPETKKKKNNNQKGGQKGGQNNNVATQSAQPPKQLTAAERKAKAAQIFQQKNSLTDEQRRERNKAKKEKKNTVKSPQQQAQKSTPAGDAKKDDKAAPAQPAAPVKSAEQIKKEREENREAKVQHYLSAVNAALPGSTIFFKLNLHELQKDSRQIVDDLNDRWKSSVDRVLSSELFLAKFLAALPASFSNHTAADIIPVGRYGMRAVPFNELPINLASLLAGPTEQGGERKSSDEVFSLVDGFLEGLFDHKPKVNPRAKLLNNDEDADEDDEYVGSAGNSRSQTSFADFLVGLPESKKSTEGSSSSSSSNDAGSSSGSNSGASSGKSKGKGKEKEDAESPVVETKQGEGFGRGGAAGAAVVKDEHNPTTFLSEELRQDSEKYRGLAKKIPRNWRFGYIASPIFAPSQAALVSGGGRGGRGGNRGGRGGGRGDAGSERKSYDAGFMYSGNGLDHSYVFWKGAEMIFLFTTGRERTGAVAQQQPVAAPVKKEEKKEEKKVDLSAIQANGKPAWKQPRKDL